MRTKRHLSQKNRILNSLKRGDYMTSLKALRLFGCLNLKGRIFEIRELGYPVETSWIKRDGKIYAKYQIKGWL